MTTQGIKLRFVQLDVFTTTRFLGNPLAIVYIPNQADNITQSQKQLIAREFNLSETVFLHDHETTSNDEQSPTAIDIFTTSEELPFAGHPTVGTGWFLLSQSLEENSIVLKTKAGEVPVHRVSNTVRLQVPADFKVHGSLFHPTVKHQQTQLTHEDYHNGINGPEATVSIVKGMTFVLLQLNSEDALRRLHTFRDRLNIEGLGDWAGFAGVYAFYEGEDGIVRTRMMDGLLEDPATGSAASTLGGWLALNKEPGIWQFKIVQGVEMGRRSEIEVTVQIDLAGRVEKIELGGSAVKVMEGWLEI